MNNTGLFIIVLIASLVGGTVGGYLGVKLGGGSTASSTSSSATSSSTDTTTACLEEKLGKEKAAAISANPSLATAEDNFKILPCYAK